MTYRPNLLAPIASTTQAGVIKADGTTIIVASDATASVIGTAVTALPDISSGSLGGPASSDVDTLNRAGTDYKVTLSARSALVRKTPAGSRTVTLTSGATSAILTASDNDKQVVVTGNAGTLSADGTITDGFRCFVVNKTGNPLSYSGIIGLGGSTTLSSGCIAQVYLAASTLECAAISGSTVQPVATTSSAGAVKPDGSSLSVASDGTLSVVTTTTHALPAGNSISATDEVATFATISNSDVKYTLSQITSFTQSNVQSWSTGARPSTSSGQLVFGYNSSIGRFEFWNGSAWNQHVRLTDLSASSNQLLGGSTSGGVAAAVNIGSGLQLSNAVLSALPSIVAVTTITSSGSSQALAFPTSGSRAYDVTLSANCVFTLGGGGAGELQTLTLIIRGGAGGFSVTLPSNVKWKGGTLPAVDTSAGSLFLIRFHTSDGGATFAGNF